MSLQILSLNSNQVPACAAAQEKILALLSSGEGAMEPKQFGTAKELFYALAEALKTAQTILLLVEPDRYLRTKEQLLRAMGLSTVPNPELMEALQKSPVQLPEEDFSRHAAIPVGAAAFPTQDGLFAGFMLTAGRQTILFLPLDNRRIDSILKAEAGAFLSGSQLGRQRGRHSPKLSKSRNRQMAPLRKANQKTETSRKNWLHKMPLLDNMHSGRWRRWSLKIYASPSPKRPRWNSSRKRREKMSWPHGG